MGPRVTGPARVMMYAELKRTCKKCDMELALTTEHFRIRPHDGRWEPDCRICTRKERVRYAKAYRAKHPEKVMGAKLLCTYGLSLEEYEEKSKRQNGVCAICSKPNVPKNGYVERLSVDHDHVTGQVRDLLCRKCNMEIGVYEKNAKRLSTYLAKFKKQG
jgi:hypothetical protein